MGRLTLASLFLVSTSIFAASPGDTNHIDFSLISDPHVDIYNDRAVNINPNSSHKGNDLDRPSFITLTSKMSTEQLAEDPSFVVVLGDLPSHNAGSHRSDALSQVFQTFYEQFNPKPMFYSFGNNDSIPRNYGPFKYKGESPYEIAKSINMKGGFLSSGEVCPFKGKPCLINKSETYGYYSAYIGDHLRLVSLNSVIFVSRPGFSPSREGDKRQMEWLGDELKASQAKNEQVILTMHVAPNSWMPEYETQFKTLINTYPNVVVAIFAAHSHYDELRAIKTKQSLIPVIFSAGLSTGHGNAASFKTISMGRQSSTSPWAVENYTTYYFKGYKADSSVVTKYYDFNSAFCRSSGELFTACFKKQIEKTGKGYAYTAKAGKLISEHVYANPAEPGHSNVSSWVMSY